MLNDFQTRAIFPVDAVPPPGPLPATAQRLKLPTPDGETLQGVHIPPRNSTAAQASWLMLGFGGNAWNGEDVATYLHEIYPDAHVVTFHYRGYRPSTGRPSAAALIDDAPLAYDLAVEQVQPRQTIAVGFSIGSGIAANLAGRRDLDGVILVTPFDSLRAVAESAFPWFPVGPFFAHEIDAAGALSGSKVPVAILGAERDTIIAPARTDALRERVANLVYDRTFAGAGHNDIYVRSDFQQAMREALSAVTQKH